MGSRLLLIYNNLYYSFTLTFRLILNLILQPILLSFTTVIGFDIYLLYCQSIAFTIYLLLTLPKTCKLSNFANLVLLVSLIPILTFDIGYIRFIIRTLISLSVIYFNKLNFNIIYPTFSGILIYISCTDLILTFSLRSILACGCCNRLWG